MTLTAADHAQARRQVQDRHNRKVPVVVQVVETVDAAGAPLVLATSDVPSEQGRYFRVTLEGGKWRCSCGAFRSLGGCHHVGHLAATASQRGTA